MTQVLPKNDAFANGTVAYGDFVQSYLRLRPSTAGTDTTTGFSVVFLAGGLGSMHDAYGGLLPPSVFQLVPTSNVLIGSDWSAFGAASVYETLDDTFTGLDDDTTYATASGTGSNPTNATAEVGLTAIATPGQVLAGNMIVRWRAKRVGATTFTLSSWLYCGATQIAQMAPQVPGDGIWSTYSQALTQPQIDAINAITGGWSLLRFRWRKGASAGAVECRLTAVQVDVTDTAIGTGSASRPLPTSGPASVTNGSAASQQPTGQMHRLEISGNVKAQKVFHVIGINGLPNIDGFFKYAWIGARISGTAAAGTVPTQYHEGGRGYWFALQHLSGGLLAWQLLRKDSAPNQFTVLDEFTSAQLTLSSLQLSTPRMLRIELSDESGDVRIKCYTAATTASGSIPPGNPAESEIFSYLDNSASKITADGRCGFVTSTEFTVSGVKHVQVIDSFKIISGSTLTILDEFSRVRRDQCLAVTDGYGFGGRDLSCDWLGGIGSTMGRVAYRSTHATFTNRLRFIGSTPVGSASTPLRGGYLFSTREATDPKASNRSAVFVFSSSGSAPTARAAGIFLRAAGGTDALAPTAGYLVQVDHVASTLFVYSLEPSAQTAIARVAGAILISADTDQTLKVELRNLADAGGLPDAAVEITVTWNGALQTLVSLVTGVSIAAGVAYDTRSARTISGVGEGIRVFLPDGTRELFADTWTEGSFTATVLLPQDMASISVASEVTNHSGQTLSFPLEWPVSETRVRGITRRRFEDGHKYARQRFGTGRRRWRVGVHAMTTAQRSTLRTNWSDHDGCVKAFDWLPPNESTALPVHFATPLLGQVLRNPGVHATEFEIEELLEP